MSALGQSRHTCPLSPKADIRSALAQVRFGPKADIRFFEDRCGIAHFMQVATSYSKYPHRQLHLGVQH